MQKLTDLKNRLLISSISIVLIFCLIYFSHLLFMRFIVALVISFIGVLASVEFLNIAKDKNQIISRNPFVFFIVLEILSFFVSSQMDGLNILPIFVFVIFMIYQFLSNFKKIENSIFRISIASFGFIYIAIPFGMLMSILYMPMQDGKLWIFYLLVVSKFSDIGGYFGGKLFGKRKLAEHISPKKTIFGSVSGFVFAILASFLFLFFAKPNLFDFNWVLAIVLGVVLSGFSQIGDLCESLLKRDAQIKDSSTIPGIGGILDLVDSLMLNIPILYCYLLG
jgi:phosphatidate cytidylyltransferase